MNALLIRSVITLFRVIGFRLEAYGATIELFPASAADCNEELETVANTLNPGDELVLHGGTYSQSCRRAITVNGTATNPIVIRAAVGESPLLTRPGNQNFDYPQNNIEIVDSSYLILSGLHFQRGDSGVRFIGGHHITLENSEIYETGNNAISMNSGNYDSFTIRHNHIHHTGLLDLSVGTTEGEGMYLGCNNNSCWVSNSLIEGNYIHHLRGTSDGGNDGIEVKTGSGGNRIRHNVIHDTTIGTRFPCIFVYGGGTTQNIVEGNALWNCGEAIQVVSDAIVRNNLILNSDVGIVSAPHSQVASMRNIMIVNNTVVGHPECLYLRWSGASGMTLANNAVYCGGGTAVNAAGLSGAGVTIKANFVEGAMSGASIDATRFATGGTTATGFRNVSGKDLWPLPSSPLIGHADPVLAPPLDFGENPRTAPNDVGAYESDGTLVNPGWLVQAGFKTWQRADDVPPSAPANVTAR